MKLVPMKLSKAQMKGDGKDTPTLSGADGSTPQYHYDTQLSLGSQTLDKLGMKDLPKVGDKVHVHARGHVTSVRHETRHGGKPSRHVDIQMTHMSVGSKGDPEDALDAVNGGLEEANE